MRKNLLAEYGEDWFRAKGTVEHLPMHIIVRELAAEKVPIAELPFVVELIYPFEKEEATGLPSEDEYEKIEAFHTKVFDALEAEGIGLLVYVETWNGQERQICYVTDIDEALKIIEPGAKGNDDIEFDGEEDAEWNVFQTLMSGISDEGSEGES